ncbi:MAG: hypothetical protein U1A77_23785 [Pirellulales bacterium]
MGWSLGRCGVLAGCILGLVGCGDVPTPAPPPAAPAKVTRPAPPPPAPAKAPPVSAQAFPNAGAAVDALVAAIKDNNSGSVAQAEGWFKIQGAAATDPLKAIVLDADAPLERRLAACRALSQTGAPGGVALLGCLDVKPDQMRSRVIESLSRVKPSSPEIVKQLRAIAVNEGDVRQRTLAMIGLGRIGPPAREVAPDLQQILNDTSLDEQLRGEAGKTLKLVDPRRGLMGVAK